MRGLCLYQLSDDWQEYDDGGSVASKLCEAGDKGSDQQEGQAGWNLCQRLEMPPNP